MLKHRNAGCPGILLAVLILVCVSVSCGRMQDAHDEDAITAAVADSAEPAAAEEASAVSTETDTAEEEAHVETREIVFSEKFEHLSNMTENELERYFRNRKTEEPHAVAGFRKKNADADDEILYETKLEKDRYTDMRIEDGLLKMTVTEEQAEMWKDYCAAQAKAQESILKQVNEKYSAECSENHDVISVCYDRLMPFDTALNCVGRTTIFCAMYQLFDGVEDFSVSLNIYNYDTGKLVAGGDMEKDDVSYSDTEWSQSYTLNADEAESLVLSKTGAEGHETVHVKPTFTNGMSVINILKTAGGDDYRCLYLDENDAVVMVTDEAQRAAFIKKWTQFLKNTGAELKEKNSSCDITWNDDFSKLELRFDAGLSKQDQAEYFIYAETMCMLIQAINGDGSSFYIDIDIYDSSTGELVSSGNTESGISWNIGKSEE